MPTTFTITTDDVSEALRIITVIRDGKTVTNARVPTVEIKGNSATLPVPTMAAPAASPTPPAVPASPPQPTNGAPTPVASAGATVSQGAEAVNAQMDIFLKQHKAAEAKAILQKYNAKRISDITDVNTLHSIYREFGGQ